MFFAGIDESKSVKIRQRLDVANSFSFRQFQQVFNTHGKSLASGWFQASG